MRIDKYLKVSRLIKRREVAKTMCDKGYVLINGRPAKPSSEVALQDLININNPNGQSIKLTVKEIKDNCPASIAADLYELLQE